MCRARSIAFHRSPGPPGRRARRRECDHSWTMSAHRSTSRQHPGSLPGRRRSTMPKRCRSQCRRHGTRPLRLACRPHTLRARDRACQSGSTAEMQRPGERWGHWMGRPTARTPAPLTKVRWLGRATKRTPAPAARTRRLSGARGLGW